MAAEADGGALKGGAPRAVWLVTETDPRLVSARSTGQDMCAHGNASHLVWNPWDGELAQLIPATRAARCLGEEVGREGRACLQIMVVARSREPFTSSRLIGLAAIMSWLDSWGVARRWPAGPPLAVPQSYLSPAERRPWARGGHFGHSQVPEAGVPGPGAIDIRKITGPDTPAAEIPRPRQPSGRQAIPAPRPSRLEAVAAPLAEHIHT